MEIIKSWEFNKELLDRNIAIILKIYREFLNERIPSVEDIVDAIENLNRQILAQDCTLDDDAVEAKLEECLDRGDFACMDTFVTNILDKFRHAAIVSQEFILGSSADENDTSVFIVNDCQNIIKEFIGQNESLISQGTDFTQVFKKPDLIPKLKAGA